MRNISGNERPSVKNNIVAILADEFPLSINEIRSRLRISFKHSVSYQAVHKELVKLLEEGVVHKEDAGYLLNISWIIDKSNLYRRMEINYTRERRYSLGLMRKIQHDGDTVHLEFSTLTDIDNYFISVMEFFNTLVGKDDPIIMQYRHNTWPVLHAQREQEILQKQPENTKFYCLCGSYTPLDKWACDYERSIGMHVMHKESATNFSVHVYGDVIIQFNTDPAIVLDIDSFYKSSAPMTYNPKRLIDIQNKKARHTVMMYKNSMLADQIRREVMSLFKTATK
jgi:DNA-binding Lrp family transcriptional regulator